MPVGAAGAWLPSRREWVVLLLCAALVCAQLFVPPVIGLADNGDFPKVTGRAFLGPTPTGRHSHFAYFVSDYERSPEHWWDSGLLSVESAIAWAAAALATVHGRFDVRVLGAVHLGLFLLIVAVGLRAMRRLPGAVYWPVALVAAWAATDVMYVAYGNSFYMDAAAILGLAAVAVAATWVALGERHGIGGPAVLALAGVWLATSKSQHSVPALAVAGFALATAAGTRRWRERLAWVGCAGVVALAAALLLASVPAPYRATAAFNMIFFRILPDAPEKASVLRELGLPLEHARLSGMHAFQPDSPIREEWWREDFIRRTGHEKLALYFVRHPKAAARHLWRVLATEAPRLRSFGNFRREDGFPPGAQSHRVSTWSGMRRALWTAWPGHALLVYGLGIVAGVRAIRQRRRFGGVLLLLLAIGAAEFGMATLADGIETRRQLLLFHGATDLLLCGLMLEACLWWHDRRARAAVRPLPLHRKLAPSPQ